MYLKEKHTLAIGHWQSSPNMGGDANTLWLPSKNTIKTNLFTSHRSGIAYLVRLLSKPLARTAFVCQVDLAHLFPIEINTLPLGMHVPESTYEQTKRIVGPNLELCCIIRVWCSFPIFNYYGMWEFLSLFGPNLIRPIQCHETRVFFLIV